MILRLQKPSPRKEYYSQDKQPIFSLQGVGTYPSGQSSPSHKLGDSVVLYNAAASSSKEKQVIN